MIVTLFLTLAFVVSSTLALAKKAGPSYWKNLSKTKTIGTLKFFQDVIDKEVKIAGKMKDRYYGLDMKPVRAALEKAGVAETVTVEIRYRSELIERLGTYSPEVTNSDGQTVVSFACIPDNIRVLNKPNSPVVDNTQEITSQGGYNEESRSSDEAPTRSFSPSNYNLVFKDTKGKIKAKLTVLFNQVN